MVSDCGANEIYNACADPCNDVASCSDPNFKFCPDSPVTVSTCVCRPGYKMSDGVCVPAEECPAPEGKPSNWSDWSDCNPAEGYVFCLFYSASIPSPQFFHKLPVFALSEEIWRV